MVSLWPPNQNVSHNSMVTRKNLSMSAAQLQCRPRNAATSQHCFKPLPLAAQVRTPNEDPALICFNWSECRQAASGPRFRYISGMWRSCYRIERQEEFLNLFPSQAHGKGEAVDRVGGDRNLECLSRGIEIATHNLERGRSGVDFQVFRQNRGD